MRTSWMGAALSGVCVAFVLTPQAKAAELQYTVVVTGSGTATYSFQSDDPLAPPEQGTAPATFSADGGNSLSGILTDVRFHIPSANLATDAEGDNFNGPAVVTGVTSAGIGQIFISGYNGDFGNGSSFGEVTLNPTSVIPTVQNGEIVYEIAGTGKGDAKVSTTFENPDINADPPDFFYDTAISIDITSFTGQVYVTSVPLPASLPIFGGALVALGAAGYGLKRNAKAASVSAR